MRLHVHGVTKGSETWSHSIDWGVEKVAVSPFRNEFIR